MTTNLIIYRVTFGEKNVSTHKFLLSYLKKFIGLYVLTVINILGL